VTTEFAAVPAYRAPVWLAGGHAQTIYPFLLPRASIRYRRERVDAPDSDFWDLDWLDAEPTASTSIANPASPVVVLFHGLEGGSRSHYALALMSRLASMGWRGVVPHFRGCGGEPNRHPRAYHSGDYEEIDAMLVTIHRRVRAVTPEAPLYAVGVSLGGSALLNWLGRAGRDASRLITAAAAVSAPIDLTGCRHRDRRRSESRVFVSFFVDPASKKHGDGATLSGTARTRPVAARAVDVRLR
jgi:predicted alpha/beta-fold hydrolase